MPEPLIRNVSDTAFLIAAHRAAESDRPDALFRDPLAGRLAGEHGRRIVAALPRETAMMQWSVAMRTVIIDDFLQAEIARGADTVVNLGAGLDTRPYRMALPADLRWVEVDYAPIVDLKESRLAGESPRCRLERVRMDLADVPSRRRLFADLDASGKHLVVLTEGVVPYLGVDEAGVLADDLRGMAHLRSWIIDYFSKETLRYRKKQGRERQFRNAPFRFEPDDWFAFFQHHGWRAKDARYFSIESERLARPIPLPLAMRFWIKASRYVVPKGKRDALQKMAGYILLEPAS